MKTNFIAILKEKVRAYTTSNRNIHKLLFRERISSQSNYSVVDTSLLVAPEPGLASVHGTGTSSFFPATATRAGKAFLMSFPRGLDRSAVKQRKEVDKGGLHSLCLCK